MEEVLRQALLSISERVLDDKPALATPEEVQDLTEAIMATIREHWDPW